MPSQTTDHVLFPPASGFRSGERGVHNTRTLMLNDVVDLFNVVPPGAPREAYEQTIVHENVLGKRTSSTRIYSFRRLTELYSLDPVVPVFRLLRTYWSADDGDGRPVLAMLCALARDPILRLTTEPVLALDLGAPFEKGALERAVETGAPGRFSPTSVAKIARMTGSSWTQSGHLGGRALKTRTRPRVTPAALAYALVLGYLSGVRGGPLFETLWARVLDAPLDRLHDLAQDASRRGLLTYRNAGGIVDMTFASILTDAELAEADDQG